MSKNIAARFNYATVTGSLVVTSRLSSDVPRTIAERLEPAWFDIAQKTGSRSTNPRPLIVGQTTGQRKRLATVDNCHQF